MIYYKNLSKKILKYEKKVENSDGKDYKEANKGETTTGLI